MNLFEQVRHCIWLNMNSKVQNPTITPWDLCFGLPLCESPKEQITVLSVALLIRKTGIPIGKSLQMYARWGEAERVLKVLRNRPDRWAIKNEIGSLG